MAMKQYDVFLSHHSAEKPVVEFLARKLDEAGIRPFLDKWHLIPGEPIQEALEAALDQSDTCAVFIGAAGTGPWANEEMRAALAERVRNSSFRVIPVLLPGVESEVLDRLPHFLKRLRGVDFRVGLDDEDAFKNLLAGIRGHAPKLTRENASPEQIRLACPYRGLSAFREEDESLFFGRENWSERLLAMVQQQPFVAVLGASGSGKSSLVYAGLIPKLRSQNNWLIVSFRPGEHPLHTLSKTLIPFLYQDPLEHISKSKQLAEQLQNDEIVLKDVIEKILDAYGKTDRFLLVIDQFEELYALCDDVEERTAFILGINPQSQSVSRLKPAISESKQGASASFSFEPGDLSPGIHIILTLRSDFLGQTHSQPELSQAIANHHIIVPAMNTDDLRRAITEPASRAGFPLHDEVVDLLLEQSAGREGALPLLEFALTRIWDGLARGVEAAETLQQIGGVGGALANKAQGLFDELNEIEQQIARRAFLAMIRLGEGTQDSRRRVNIAEIVGHKDDPQQVRRVLHHFAQPGARLITLDDDTAEITHEALFEHWEVLKSWLDAGRDDLRFHRQLEETVKEWEVHKRPAGSLWRPPKLGLLRQYHQRNAQDMTALQVAFLQESVRKEKQTRFWKRATAAVLVILTVISVIGAMWAVRSERVAQQERLNAEINEIEALNQTAKALFASHDELNALLAATKAGKKLKETQRIPLNLKYRTEFNLEEILSNIRQKNIFEGFKGNWAILSPDGTKFASIDRNIITIWDLHQIEGKKPIILQAYLGETVSGYTYIRDITFNPDSKMIASSCPESKIRIWDVLSGQEITVINDWAEAITFSPDSQILASASGDKSIKFWNVITGELIKSFPTSISYFDASLKFSFDNQFIALESSENIYHNNTSTPETISSAQIFRIQDGSKIATFQISMGRITDIEFSPDNQFIMIGDDLGTIRTWDIKQEAMIGVNPMSKWRQHFGRITDLIFSIDGKWLVSSGEDRMIKTSNLTEPAFKEFQTNLIVNGIAINTDSTQIVTTSSYQRGEYRKVEIWDVMDKSWMKTYFDKVQKLPVPLLRYNNMQFSSDGTMLAIGGDYVNGEENGAMAVVVDMKDSTVIFELREPLFDTCHVAIAHDNLIAVCYNTYDSTTKDVLLTTYNVKSSKKREQILKDASAPFVISPDGEILALTKLDNTIELWSISNAKNLFVLQGHSDLITRMIFNNKGTLLASGSNDNNIRLWDIKNGQKVLELQGHASTISSLTFNFNDTVLASGSSDKVIKLWSLPEGKEFDRIERVSQINTILSRDSTILGILSGWDVKLMDIKNKHEIVTLLSTNSYHYYYQAMALSPDGKTLAIGQAYNNSVFLCPLGFLDDMLISGCEWLQDYLRNPYANLSDEDRALCDDILNDAEGELQE